MYRKRTRFARLVIDQNSESIHLGTSLGMRSDSNHPNMYAGQVLIGATGLGGLF